MLLWLRAEERADEHRTPLVPADAARLVEYGMEVVVEESPHRVHSAEAYRSAGCTIVPGGQWPAAPHEAYVLGLKELPATGEPLRHRHIYFGHCYKAQPGAEKLLRRFVDGGGELLDLECVTDAQGRRLVAFGYWAGYIGAALAVLHDSGDLRSPLEPTSKYELDQRLARTARTSKRALVIGALGRCGSGARQALAQADRPVTAWDLAETRHLDRDAVLANDLLVNAVLSSALTRRGRCAGDGSVRRHPPEVPHERSIIKRRSALDRRRPVHRQRSADRGRGRRTHHRVGPRSVQGPRPAGIHGAQQRRAAHP